MSIENNQLNGKVLTRDTGSGSYTLAQLSVNANVETVTGATINKLFWSTNGNITIARGANTKITLHNAGFWDLHGSGDAIGSDASANIVITVVTGGTLVMELKKQTTYNETY